MLATVMRVPSHTLNLARRTTSLSVVALGELTAVAFPRLAMPTDSIAVRAWATGLTAGDPVPAPSARASQRTARTS